MPIQRIKIRRDSQVLWELNDPILADGELGFERDTYKLKIGNGVSHWNDLAYFQGFDQLSLNIIEGWPPNVTTTEVGYLEGVTSNIQEQLNNKSDSDHTHDIGVLLGAGAQPNQVAVWDGIKWSPANINGVLTGWTKQEFFFDDIIELDATPVGPVLWFKNGLLLMNGEDMTMYNGDVLTAVYQAG
jgi:hypothetical protein